MGKTHEFKRIRQELLIMLLGIAFFVSGVHTELPPVIQMLADKVVLVSMGFSHAHMIRKVAFPEVDWEAGSFTPLNILGIVIYATVIHAYAIAG